MALPLVVALLVVAGSRAGMYEGDGARSPRVVLVTESVGCREAFQRLVCDGFRRAVKRTGIEGRIITPTAREDLVDVLELIARQPYELLIVFGFGYYEALGEAARRQPSGRFAIMDASRDNVAGQPRNVQGVVLRASEAAYLAGWLAGSLERGRTGRDTVGVVAGVKIPSVDDFVIGFRAGARRASPGARVLIAYSSDFVDAAKCKAIARRQIARGAGVVFNVAGGCGLGTLEAAKERGVWGIGVDTDQSFLGPHILTSVVKRYDAAFLAVLRQVKAGRIPTGRDTVLTLREDAVGLSPIRSGVPASLRKAIERLRGPIAVGTVRVPGAFPDPR